MSVPPTNALIGIRGATLAVTDAGDEGLPVVINAHGLMMSRAAAQTSGVGDYSPVGEGGRRRLISYDARGHGESSGSMNPADYEWPSLARDLLALADVYSPEHPVATIGLSMGTGTLLHAVTHLPNRFSRLVLSAPPTAWQTRALQTRMYAAMADLFENGSADEIAAALRSIPVPPIFADLPEFSPQPDVDLSVLPTVMRGAGASDLPPVEVLAGVTQPTLILAWAGDPGHPLSTALTLADVLPNAELVVSETSADVRTWGARAAAFLAR